MRVNNTIHTGRQQKSKRVALLQQAGNKSAPPDRNGFHGERCSHAPLTAHPDSVEQSQKEENSVIRRESGKNFDQGKVQNVDDERDAASVAVGKQTQKNRAVPTRGPAAGRP